MYRSVSERGGDEVLIGTTAIVVEVGEETDDNLVVRLSSRFAVVIAASDVVL